MNLEQTGDVTTKGEDQGIIKKMLIAVRDWSEEIPHGKRHKQGFKSCSLFRASG